MRDTANAHQGKLDASGGGAHGHAQTAANLDGGSRNGADDGAGGQSVVGIVEIWWRENLGVGVIDCLVTGGV